MVDELITAGEFARLACTTKRTILWYDQKGILKPEYVKQNGYRFYSPRQIIDYQVILLLRKLRFSIEEIEKFLAKNSSLKSLFGLKQKAVEEEIASLQRSLITIKSHYRNLENNGTLVQPREIVVKPFSIYYIDKVGSYSQIYNYDQELKACFLTIPVTSVFLTLFYDGEYRPRKSTMKIGVIVTKGMVIRPEAKEIVKKYRVPSFKALTYTHLGSGSSLSLMWKELEKYARKHNYQVDRSLPFYDMEFYRPDLSKEKVSEEGTIFVIYLPIR